MNPKKIEAELHKTIVKLLKKYPRENDTQKLIDEAIVAIQRAMEQLAHYVEHHPELPQAIPNEDYSLGVTAEGRNPETVQVLWIYTSDAGEAFLKALGVEGVEGRDHE